MNRVNRRQWIQASAAGLSSAIISNTAAADRGHSTPLLTFHRDHIIGTSLDICVAGVNQADAERCERTILDEIERLRMVLSIYDPSSELSRVNRSCKPLIVSEELADVLEAYTMWYVKTGGVFHSRMGEASRVWKQAEIDGQMPSEATCQHLALQSSKRNWHFDRSTRTLTRTTDASLDFNALGKVYILEKALAAARQAVPTITGLLLNLGGDVCTWGNATEPAGFAKAVSRSDQTGWGVGIQDPHQCHDNARPLAGLRVRNKAVASSGGYQRYFNINGTRYSHIIDPRTGLPAGIGATGKATPSAVAGATVVADDNITANALATTLCILTPDEGMRLVASVTGAECLIVSVDGSRRRSPGLELLEVDPVRNWVFADKQLDKGKPWPEGYQVSVALELPKIEAKRYRRPYTAVWIENDQGQAVRTLAVWGNAPKYLRDLSDWWKIGRSDAALVRAVARATRGPGKYDLVWDGKDEKGNALPQGTYTVRIEITREYGSHIRQTGKIECNTQAAKVKMEKTEESAEAVVEFKKPEKK